MHQKGGIQQEKGVIRSTASSNSKNKDTDAENYIKVSVNGFDNRCVKGFQCLICRKTFTGTNPRAALHTHMTKLIGGKHLMSAERNRKFKFKCEKCGNYAVSLEHLNMHNNDLPEDKVDKEEIVIMDYGKGTKRTRKNSNNNIEIRAKIKKKASDKSVDDIKEINSTRTIVNRQKRKCRSDAVEGKDDEHREEDTAEEEERDVKEEEEEEEEEDAEDVKWERIHKANLTQKQQQYARYLGLSFIDRDEDTSSQFKISSFAKQTGRSELYFQYYNTKKYKNCPPRSMDNFEYTSCAEMTHPRASWVVWMNDKEKPLETTEVSAPKRGSKLQGSIDDETKNKKVRR